MSHPNQHTPTMQPVVVGQVRADRRGGTIKVANRTPGVRYVVEYPQLDDEIVILSGETILQLYPFVISS